VSDYVRQLEHPRFPFERAEAERLAASYETDAAVSEGVVRWLSNGRVPPDDVLALWRHVGKEFDHDKSRAAGRAELQAFLDGYRAANRGRGRTSEEMSELRAEFGPDALVMDVITGEVVHLGVAHDPGVDGDRRPRETA